MDHDSSIASFCSYSSHELNLPTTAAGRGTLWCGIIFLTVFARFFCGEMNVLSAAASLRREAAGEESLYGYIFLLSLKQRVRGAQTLPKNEI